MLLLKTFMRKRIAISLLWSGAAFAQDASKAQPAPDPLRQLLVEQRDYLLAHANTRDAADREKQAQSALQTATDAAKKFCESTGATLDPAKAACTPKPAEKK